MSLDPAAKGKRTQRRAGSARVTPGAAFEVRKSFARPRQWLHRLGQRCPRSASSCARTARDGADDRALDPSGGPLKVALVTPRFPPDVGGLENYVGWVARALRSAVVRRHRDHDRHAPAGPGTRATSGIPVIRLGTWLTLSNTPVNPLWWAQVRRLLTRLDVDVVNAHAPVPGLADVAAFTSPVPVVMTYHAGSLVKGDHPVDPLLRAYERHVLPSRLRPVQPT